MFKLKSVVLVDALINGKVEKGIAIKAFDHHPGTTWLKQALKEFISGGSVEKVYNLRIEQHYVPAITDVVQLKSYFAVHNGIDKAEAERKLTSTLHLGKDTVVVPMDKGEVVQPKPIVGESALARARRLAVADVAEVLNKYIEDPARANGIAAEIMRKLEFNANVFLFEDEGAN